MKKLALILFIVILMIFTTLACIRSDEGNRADIYQASPGEAATATSAALEFQVQLTLTTGEAAAGLSNPSP